MGHIAVMGYGRFGRAFGELLTEAGIPYRAYDPVSEVPPPHRAGSLQELVTGASVVVIAVPVMNIRQATQQIRAYLVPSQLVLDVGSVKVKPVQALAEVLGSDIPWVGTHPLFGPISLSRAERPLRVVVCPNEVHPDAAKRARTLYERLDCEVIEQTPDEHDQIMAHTHALSFFVAKGLIDMEVVRHVPYAPPSFQVFARMIETVRGDAGHLFAAIEIENPHARDARQLFIEALTRIHGEIETRARDQTPLEIPSAQGRSPQLAQVREHIDEVDRELVALLARRTLLAQRAAQAKAEMGFPVLDSAREMELVQARRRWAEELGIDPAGVEEIFRAILRYSRRVQQTRPADEAPAGEGKG